MHPDGRNNWKGHMMLGDRSGLGHGPKSPFHSTLHTASSEPLYGSKKSLQLKQQQW